MTDLLIIVIVDERQTPLRRPPCDVDTSSQASKQASRRRQIGRLVSGRGRPVVGPSIVARWIRAGPTSFDLFIAR
jgi:hypothetical protein